MQDNLFPMLVIEKTAALEEFRFNEGLKDKTVGMVPTMGALHEGHLSLVDIAASLVDIVIVSIFVNPTQFNNPNDLKNYPRDTRKDLEMLSKKRIDVVFLPSVTEIYPVLDRRVFDFGRLEKVMEGEHRPGHFNGVAQVVSRLFEISSPDYAFFGQKDYQQLLIIKSLVKKLGLSTKIIPCPIVREKSGLAMSSRNELLSQQELEHAANISKILLRAKSRYPYYPVKDLKEWVVEEVNKDPLLNVEYFEIADTENLEIITHRKDSATVAGFIAVYIGKVRLIDNIFFD